MQTLFMGVFFIFIIIMCLVMFFVNKKDIWLQMLWVISFLIHLVFLVFMTMDINNVEMEYPTCFSRVVLDDTDIFTSNYSQELINSGNDFHVSDFNNIEQKQESSIVSARMCLRYNNSDASNVLFFTNGVNQISDYLYLPNNTVSTICSFINSSYVKKGNHLGYHCEDCAVGNTLRILNDNEASDVYEVEIDHANPLSYTIKYETPHIMWLELRCLPRKSINDWFATYIWILGFLILAFGCYFIVQVIVKGNKAVLE